MKSAKQIAEQATIQSFLNCYFRETGSYEVVDGKSGLVPETLLASASSNTYALCRLPRLGLTLCAGIAYLSPTGRHVLRFPVHGSSEGAVGWFEVDYVFLVTTLTKELTLQSNSDAKPDELVLRVIQSCNHMESFVAARVGDVNSLYGSAMDFIEAEQSLLLGHLIHPTPKSRQGIPEWEHGKYDPELKGSFPLHYFRAHSSIVKEDSTQSSSATALIKQQLAQDGDAISLETAAYCASDDYSLIPVHPLQAQWLLRQPKVQALLESGKLSDLGTQGRAYSATSSLRTVYQAESPFMLKCSLQVKITNSLRINKYKELERGIEVDRLLNTEVGASLSERFPQFSIIGDPAFITVHIDGQEESGFEVVLRDNPFRGEAAKHTSLIAGLVQDPVYGDSSSRLGEIIKDLALKEQRSTSEVSVDWFRRYVAISLKPMVWLYLRYGIALEAHQQNSVVRLKDGYPEHVYYRDNQGYYFCESTRELLTRLLPDIGGKSQTICEDDVADERFRYYLIFNHMFGLINGFGSAGLVDEHELLAEVRNVLEELRSMDRKPSQFLTSLLTTPMLPCKANLLTRLGDMDELVGAMESQSVYVMIENPLLTGAVRYVRQ